MNQDQALILREAANAYAKSIYRKSRHELAGLYRAELADRGQYLAFGGPVSKDEYVSALMQLRYPVAKMNESVHVLYHVDGITNDICEHCMADARADAHFEAVTGICGDD